MRAKDGKRLYRTIEVKVFHPGNEKFTRKIVRAPAHRGMLPDAIDKTVMDYAEKLDASSPFDYRMIEVATNKFNFICEGEKQVANAS